MQDVSSTIISQYSNSPTLTALIASWNACLDPSANLLLFYQQVWDIQTATGFGLDDWGQILGISRYISLPSTGQYVGFNNSDDDWLPLSQGPMYGGGSIDTGFALSDDAYRTLLLAKALANISNCSIQSLNQLAQAVFGPGAMYVNDLGDMAMEYVFTGVPTAVQLAIAQSSGVLPHPTGVGVTVVLENPLTVSVLPTTLSITGASSSESTASATVTASGGESPYTYAWSWQSGGAGISIDDPTSATTTFTASSLSPGQTLTGVALCTVTDAASEHGLVTVSVSITRVTAVSAVVAPTSISYTGAASSETTGAAVVSASGGSGAYTYAWTWASGGSGITITTASAASTTFSASLSPGGSDSGTAQCVVTDGYGQTSTITLPVSIARVTTLSVAASPTSLSYTGASSTESTGSTTATASGGGGTYTYSWTWQSGGAGITINQPAQRTTNFTAASIAPGVTYTGTALVTASDQYGQTATATVSVSIARVTQPSASVSPTSAASSGTATSQTTNSVTVSVSDGVTPYAYAWIWQSGGTGLTIDSPSAATTTFSGSGMTHGNIYSGSAQCTITDAYGQQTSVNVPVEIACTIPYTYDGSITSGSYTTLTGYDSLVPFGSITPTTDNNGYAVQELSWDSSSNLLRLHIASSSSLGKSYFANLTIGGVSPYSSSSSTYSYSGGVSMWSWTTGDPGLAGTLGWNYL